MGRKSESASSSARSRTKLRGSTRHWLMAPHQNNEGPSCAGNWRNGASSRLLRRNLTAFWKSPPPGRKMTTLKSFLPGSADLAARVVIDAARGG